ncbi:MAG: hypothetical protein GY755_24155 [Chloroflexi bacterium]|nr:hypothetical protein [Chloroflexota bacterium]
MKIVTIAFILLLILGCDSEHKTTIIEGVWQSNKELTIRNYSKNEKLTQDRKEFLERNLGKMFVSYRGNKAKIFFDDIPESEMEPQTFEIVLSNKEKVVVKVHSKKQGVQIFTYYWSDECVYIIQKEWGYSEYFCRKNT